MSVYETNAPGAVGADGYANASLAANTAYKNTLARINQKRSGTLRQFGYLGDVDPTTGTIANLRVDPNNAYGGLQSMLRTQAGDFQNAHFAAEDRGLHGGLAHKADSELKYQAGAQSAQLGQDLTGAIGGYQDDQNQAAYTRDQALYQAQLDQTRAAIEAQAFNQGDYSGVDYPDYGEDPIQETQDAPQTQAAAPGTRAQTLAGKVISNATKRAVATSKVANASAAAKTVAAKAGQTSSQQALAARSAGLNAQYGLPKAAPKPAPKNAYTSGQKKRG